MTFLLIITIYLVKKAQITLLVAKKVQILSKYSDFSDIFLEGKALVLQAAINLNQYAIKLQKGQQLFYSPIYCIRLVIIKMLKICIKTNLAKSFIWSLKLLANIFIFFVRKLNSTFYLYVDYCNFNNLTIKNQYLLFIINELLDQLNRAKRFSKLNFTSAYYQIKIKKGDKRKRVFWIWYT